MVINPLHTTNYNYEFDLVQADRHRAAMATHFSAAPNLCKQISAGKLSSVEVLSKAIAQIGYFDDTMNAVVVRDFEAGVEEAWAACVATPRRRFLEPKKGRSDKHKWC
jgi:hypothetical protein